MKNLFAFDSKRGSKYAVELGPLYLDYSKNRFNEKTLQYLLELADEVKLRDKIEAMFTGEKINITENRAVLHTALRNRQNTPVYVDGKNVMPEINAVLAKMKKFTDAVRYGEFKGATGKKLTSIVNIGIGGSDLGPVMAAAALKEYWAKDIKCYFISNIDGSACEDVLSQVDPETTLFVIVSKTFTTIETLTKRQNLPQMADRRFGRVCGCQTFRRRFHQRERSGKIRHQHRQHVRILGFRRRPLFDVVGGRLVDCPCRRDGKL